MVRDLHDAGIEVILDVVYNHTAEGNHMGPTLSMRGIDNAAYYRLVEDDPRYYMDYTGTGNSLNVRNPHTLQLIMDSLRYWVTEMHVDGFRFDLASTLAREFYDVDRLSAFFDLVQQDPVISQVKLIAEPWDVGPGGYQVGNFPPAVDASGTASTATPCATSGAASPARSASSPRGIDRQLRPLPGRRPPPVRVDQLRHRARRLHAARPRVATTRSTTRPTARTATTGRATTARGTAGSRAPPTTPAVLDAARSRQQRNFITTLMLSQGVPMLLHGDEMGRTQSGNNNVYCQDNAISWVDWSLLEQERGPGRVHRGGHRPAARPSGVPPPPVLRGTPDRPPAPRRRAEPLVRPAGHRVVPALRAGDDRRGLGLRLRQVRRGVPQRAGDQRGRPARRAGHRRLVPALPQRPLRGPRGHAAGRGVRQRLGDRRRHGGGRGDHAARSHRASWRPSRPVTKGGGTQLVPARSVLVLQRLD